MLARRTIQLETLVTTIYQVSILFNLIFFLYHLYILIKHFPFSSPNIFSPLTRKVYLYTYIKPKIFFKDRPVGWGFKIHRLLHCRGVRLPDKRPGYDTKQSDGDTPIMPEFWGMQSTPSLPSLPGPLCPGVVAPDRVLSMGQIELNCVITLNWIV